MRAPELDRSGAQNQRLRPALSEFAVYMEHKLRRNDHKPDWRTCSLAYLRGRLNQELAELDEAVQSGDPYRIYDECADVANFAMMIADRAKSNRREGGMIVDRC
ncbi:MAG: hypothetical protein ACM3ZU_08170 [Bacteroidota bacterium]